jgi:hypothetical protein
MKRKDKPSGAQDDRKRNDSLNKTSQDLNKSPEEKQEKKLPGEYPPQEDIMNRRDTQRVGLDVENFSRGVGIENFNKTGEPVVTERNSVINDPLLGNNDPLLGSLDDVEQPVAREMERPVPKDIDLDDDNIEFARGNESDVTKEDLEALGPKDLSLDMGDDENLLKNRVWPVDMAGSDLDIPGSELDDDNESIGAEDEENNSYSIGGDRNEDKLEGK